MTSFEKAIVFMALGILIDRQVGMDWAGRVVSVILAANAAFRLMDAISEHMDKRRERRLKAKSHTTPD